MSQELHVLLVGAGGLGYSCAFALASAAVSQLSAPLSITVIDGDTVEASNLNRQLMFSPLDIGNNKAECLCSALNLEFTATGGRIRFKPNAERLTNSNATDFIANADLIIDCTDSVQTKLLLNDLAVSEDLPFVYGGAIAQEGIALLRPKVGAPCLRCLFGEFEADDLAIYGANCSRAGILGPVAGMVGILQAELALLYLLDPRNASAVLYRVSGERPSARSVQPPADPNCPIGCSSVVRSRLDLSAERCPMTFLYTKLALEELGAGATLEVQLHDIATATSVCNAVAEAGYEVRRQPSLHPAGYWRLVVAVPKHLGPEELPE